MSKGPELVPQGTRRCTTRLAAALVTTGSVVHCSDEFVIQIIVARIMP